VHKYSFLHPIINSNNHIKSNSGFQEILHPYFGIPDNF